MMQVGDQAQLADTILIMAMMMVLVDMHHQVPLYQQDDDGQQDVQRMPHLHPNNAEN